MGRVGDREGRRGGRGKEDEGGWLYLRMRKG